MIRPMPSDKLFYGTDRWAGISYKDRRTRCYELCAVAMYLNAGLPSGTRLVHGTIFNPEHSTRGRIGHAWLLLPDGSVWEPILAEVYPDDVWLAWANPIIERTYSRSKTRKLMKRTDHFGPWHRSATR